MLTRPLPTYSAWNFISFFYLTFFSLFYLDFYGPSFWTSIYFFSIGINYFLIPFSFDRGLILNYFQVLFFYSGEHVETSTQSESETENTSYEQRRRNAQKSEGGQ